MKFLNQLGIVLLVLGAMSAVMAFFERVPRRFAWIYNWGETNAYLIMAGVFMIGIVLYWISRPKEKNA